MVLQKIMKTLEVEGGLAAAEEREKEISVNDEEMTKRWHIFLL